MARNQNHAAWLGLAGTGDDEIVPVMFRVWKSGYFKGDVDAIFPTLPFYGDDDWRKHVVTSYAHIAQHGSADLHYVISATRPATPAEYAPLKRELEQIGYNLRVVQRAPSRKRTS